jgi:hypothetical protein
LGIAATSGSRSDGSSVIGRNLPMDLSLRNSHEPNAARGESC